MIAGRRLRTAVTAVGLALTAMTAVAALAMEATLTASIRRDEAFVPLGGGPLPDLPLVAPTADADIRVLVYSLAAALLVVGLANLVAAVVLTLRERRRDLGVLRASGATPRQVVAANASAHALLGALTAVVGIPLGLLLFRSAYAIANGSTEGAATPSLLALFAVVPLGAALVGLVAGLATTDSVRRPLTGGLRAEV